MKLKANIINITAFTILVGLFLTSCGSLTLDDNSQKMPLKVRDFIILWDGPTLGVINIEHKLKFELSSEEKTTVESIFYNIHIPDYDGEVKGKVQDFVPVSLDKELGFREINVITESYGLKTFCHQVEHMLDSEQKLKPISVDLTIYTKEKGKIVINNLIFKPKNSGLLDKMVKWITNGGCSIFNLKKLFGL